MGIPGERLPSTMEDREGQRKKVMNVGLQPIR